MFFCLKLLGSEFIILGQVYLIDCFPKEMVLNGGMVLANIWKQGVQIEVHRRLRVKSVVQSTYY